MKRRELKMFPDGDPLVASNEALLKLLRLPPVRARLWEALVAHIERKGLTFAQRDLVTAVADAAVGGVRKQRGPTEEGPRYTVDCFTPLSVPAGSDPCDPEGKGHGFPENTYDRETVEEVAEVLKDCSRSIAGIRMARVWVNKPTEDESDAFRG